MPYVMGVLAHVDAGKTTLSEQLLYRAGAIRTVGRVDHGNTSLDVSDIERTRGITVFSDQSWFTLAGERVTWIDTPGHIDFAPEAERALCALDLAILMLDGTGDVEAHTLTLFELAAHHHLPLLIFINKTDLPACDIPAITERIHQRLTAATVPITNGAPDAEALSMLDDAFCERYLLGESDEADAWKTLHALFWKREAFPLLTGTALSGEGVDALLAALSQLAPKREAASTDFDALCYKVRRDENGDRITFLKLTSGTLRPRMPFTFGDTVEKVHGLRRYRGASYSPIEEAEAGDAVGVTGLSRLRAGQRLHADTTAGTTRFETVPALSAWVEPPEGISHAQLLEALRVLEDEEPALGVTWDAEHAKLSVQVMGAVQLEVLGRLLQDRFGLTVHFLPPRVLYRETIAAPVVGCGHYEPLRHYAEVHLLLSPAPRGEGISFESRCHVDELPLHFQNLIQTHVFEKAHRGVLMGAPITDVRITLLSGRAHLKHTEGGDFRQSTYRAIRQGLMKAQSVLLEPFYRFTLTLPSEQVGRAMTDLSALCATFDPPETAGDTARITGRGPVSRLMDYPATLRAYTRGKGTAQLWVDGYDRCHNEEAVLAEAAYQPDSDTQNPSASVFCSHGAGYTVLWQEADGKMHLPVEVADQL